MVIERTQAEEAEQEQRAKLLRSRNRKDEDPDREKRKADAKRKQLAQQEAEQQKQADETALKESRRRIPKNPAVSKYYDQTRYLKKLEFNCSFTIFKKKLTCLANLRLILYNLFFSLRLQSAQGRVRGRRAFAGLRFATCYFVLNRRSWTVTVATKCSSVTSNNCWFDPVFPQSFEKIVLFWLIFSVFNDFN